MIKELNIGEIVIPKNRSNYEIGDYYVTVEHDGDILHRDRFYLKEVPPATIKWLDGRFSQPAPFEGMEFKLVGNSGIRSRNDWVLKGYSQYLVSGTLVANYMATDINYNNEKKTYMVRDDHIEKISPREIETYNVDRYRKLITYIENERYEQSINKTPRITEFTVIHEANKTLWYPYLKYLDAKEFLVLHEYRTTCANLTLCLHPISKELIIPDSYKGIIIGKGGSNIKNLCQKYNTHFIIK